MNDNFKIVTFICFCFLILEGCTVKKLSENKPAVLSGTDIVDRINSLEETDELVLIKGSKISIDDNSGLTNLKVNFLIKKDSAILVSISSLLGIEVSRALILKDSIKVIDRINKTYYIKKYDELEDRFSISLDFLQLQSMLIGDFKEILLDNFSFIKRTYSSENRNFNIQISDTSFNKEIVETIIKIDVEQLFINTATILFNNKDQEYQISYSDYIMVNNYLFPGFLDIEIKNKKAPVKIAIQNKTIKLQPNKKLVLEIPESYLRSR